MTYIIKCLSGIHSRGDFSIRGGQELETTKEIYDYFNNTYGNSGRFNFATKNGTKKPAPVVEVKEEEVKPKADIKVEKKSKSKIED